MGGQRKLMISLKKTSYSKVRQEVKKLYHGRVGGLSIFFETLIENYFNQQKKDSLGVRSANKSKAVSKQ